MYLWILFRKYIAPFDTFWYTYESNITVMEHAPYSTDLVPCDFFLFPKIKSALKGTRFESVDAVKAKATQLLNSITQDDLQHCFQQWKIRMERSRDRGGDYIEGDYISIVCFFFNKGLEHESGFFIATPCSYLCEWDPIVQISYWKNVSICTSILLHTLAGPEDGLLTEIGCPILHKYMWREIK
jgi:hypothetical protein